ncbi:hypothetical protein ACFXPS_11755 [Nocardia sp. NPDC059091]|uniref:hypothetical protein n=1 Tax=Nocardia sp. NPDC059091 TaxID=3346724 RepID=UPI0036AA6CF8
MNLLDCDADPGPLPREHAQLAWRVHRYCDREVCRVRRRARVVLEEFAGSAAAIETNTR